MYPYILIHKSANIRVTRTFNGATKFQMLRQKISEETKLNGLQIQKILAIESCANFRVTFDPGYIYLDGHLG